VFVFEGGEPFELGAHVVDATGQNQSGIGSAVVALGLAEPTAQALANA
jgi:hypothetical protein